MLEHSTIRQFSRLSALLLASAMYLFIAGAAAAALPWPSVDIPKDAVAYGIGDLITVNGIPLRIQGFFVKTTQDATANWFRKRLGQPIMENKIGRALVLGRAEGQHYITVTLSTGLNGTTGTVSVANLRAAYNNRDARKTSTQYLLSRLPPGSELVTEMLSTDGSKQSRYYVLSNTYHEDVNRDRVIDLMRADGLVLRSHAIASAATSRREATQLSNGMVFIFSGDRKEAIAVIGRNDEGRTVVQVNVVSELEHYK